MFRKSEEKKTFIMFTIFFGILGVIACAVLSLMFEELKLFPLMFFIVLYPTTVISVGGSVLIYENIVDIANLHYVNKFKKQNPDDYELYDSLIKTREQLQNLIKNFEAQNLKTKEMLTEILSEQENYNSLTDKIVLLSQNKKEKFEKFCRLNNEHFEKINFSHELTATEETKINKTEAIINHIASKEKQAKKLVSEKNNSSKKMLVKNIIESTKDKDKTM